jgi:tetratricopeptide (TPR) repeat protein
MTEPLSDKQLTAIFERGNNFVRMNNLKAAIADYTTVIEHRPDFAPAYFNRGFARQHGVGDIAGAIQDYSTAIRLRPQFAEAFVNRAIAYQQQGEIDHALADYTTAIHYAPQMSHAYNNRGELLFLRGEYRAAAEDFQRARELKAGYWYAIAGLAISLHALGETEPARELWLSLISHRAEFRHAEWVRRELGWHDRLVAEAIRLIEGL